MIFLPLDQSSETTTHQRRQTDKMQHGELRADRCPWFIERLFKLKGPIIPSAKDLSRLHQFGKKVLPSIFLGYVFYAGGIWKRDIEELEKMDASEIHARRLNAKEVLTPMQGDNFIFPVAGGTVKLSG